MRRRAPWAGLLLFCLMIAAPVCGDELSLLDGMQERFEALTNYTTLLDSDGEEGRNRILYTYRKPGFIRMDFITPHKGAKLLFNPLEKRVALRPFSAKAFTLSLAPDNPLITDPKGHTVDQSDIGSLIRSVMRYAGEGTVTLLPSEGVEGQLCPRLRVEGDEVTYLLWVHPELHLPIKVVKLFPGGTRETVFLRNLTVDGPLDDAVFKP